MKPHYRARIQSPKDIDLVCKLHAEGVSVSKIIEILEPKYGKLYPRNVYTIIHSEDSQQAIQKHRDLYVNNPMAVDIAHKRIRLDGLDRERRRILKEISAMCGDTYEELGRIPAKGWTRYTTLVKRLLEIYEKAQNEIEKKPDMVNFFQSFVKQDITDEELRKQIAEIDEKLLKLRIENFDKDDSKEKNRSMEGENSNEDER